MIFLFLGHTLEIPVGAELPALVLEDDGKSVVGTPLLCCVAMTAFLFGLNLRGQADIESFVEILQIFPIVQGCRLQSLHKAKCHSPRT